MRSVLAAAATSLALVGLGARLPAPAGAQVTAQVAAFGPAGQELEVAQAPGEGEGDGGGEVVSRGGEGSDPPIVPFVVSGVVFLVAVGAALLLRARRPEEGDPER